MKPQNFSETWIEIMKIAVQVSPSLASRILLKRLFEDYVLPGWMKEIYTDTKLAKRMKDKRIP
jgi:hypothetical protein